MLRKKLINEAAKSSIKSVKSLLIVLFGGIISLPISIFALKPSVDSCLSIAAIIILCLFICSFIYSLFSLFHKRLQESEDKLKESEDKLKETEKLRVECCAEDDELPGRYFIGIDLGRDNIAYCMIDYNQINERGNFRIHEDIKNTPKEITDNFNRIRPELEGIIDELFKRAEKMNLKIDGIGFGLPGQVEPKQGIFVKSPGIESVNNAPLCDWIKGYLNEKKENNIRIAIDNDVRCATRYVFETRKYTDALCIFPGVGLGSGIIMDGKLRYGSSFTAGEIGHTSIYACFNSKKEDECLKKILSDRKCMCKKAGYHMEMLVSRGGMLSIAKNLKSDEYNKLKDNYYEIITATEYERLLSDEKEDFQNYKKHHFDEQGELTTYFLSLVLYAGNEYAKKVVELFNKHFAIGISNYVNIINPEKIFIGGGMVRGFYKDRNSHLGGHMLNLLDGEMRKYVLDTASDFRLDRRDPTETKIVAVGAALILKDKSYEKYIEGKWIAS